MRPRNGAALLEAMVAITMLVIAGIGLITYLGQTVESVRQVHQRDRETRQASAELDRISLLTSQELQARVGRSRLPCCELVVQPISAVLYRVALADTSTGAFILETSIYAPDTASTRP